MTRSPDLPIKHSLLIASFAKLIEGKQQANIGDTEGDCVRRGEGTRRGGSFFLTSPQWNPGSRSHLSLLLSHPSAAAEKRKKL